MGLNFVRGIYLLTWVLCTYEKCPLTTGTVQCMLLATQVHHQLLQDSEGGSTVKRLTLSFSTIDSLTNPLLPMQLQTVVPAHNSLLGTLDLRAVFQQSRLFSDSKAKDLNMWNVEVYYRILDKNGSFAWQLLPSLLSAAEAKPGDDLQQMLDQLPPHTAIRALAPEEFLLAF